MSVLATRLLVSELAVAYVVRPKCREIGLKAASESDKPEHVVSTLRT